MLDGKSILLGISGGIAAYKTAELTRLFVKARATVQIVMTANARRFIPPLTLQALSGQPVCTDLFDLQLESQIGHIQVARAAHLVVLAPATANLIAKVAAGIADDYLTTSILASTAPVLVCPAMNARMYANPITRRNLETLGSVGYHVLEPASGPLACNEEGPGRLPEPPEILEAALRILTPPSLAGRKILITAGPTWEPFDPVRFLTNPSTGKMGYALARVAGRRSADVTLVSGPTSLAPPQGVHLIRVTTAEEMKDSVMELAPVMDAVVMAAAVSDYRPSQVAPQKLKKTADDLAITLSRNPDILALLGERRHGGQVLVGFAAETENLIENATEKLRKKKLDFIVANNLTQPGSGFGTDTNQVRIIDALGGISELPCLSKEDVAGRILDRMELLLKDLPPRKGRSRGNTGSR